MGHIMAAEQAVPVESSSSEMVFGIVSVLLSLVAIAIPVALLVGLLVLAGRVRRNGDQLVQVEARLEAVEGRQGVAQ